MRRVLPLLLAVFAAATSACGAAPPANEPPPLAWEKSSLTVETSSGAHRFDVEIADDQQERERGLMFRRETAADAGMLFLYDQVGPLVMWMENTYLPLDMVFIGPDGVVVSVAAQGCGRPAGCLRPGMYADLRLEAARLPGRVIVPAAAVIERDGRPLVFVARGGRAQWVYILPGRSNGADTEVLPDSASGEIPVGVGDTVLTSGHLTLTHDAPVRVTAVPPRP